MNPPIRAPFFEAMAAGKPITFVRTNKEWQQWAENVNVVSLAQRQFGTTARRPTDELFRGRHYYDTTLGYPVWWQGAWVPAMGVATEGALLYGLSSGAWAKLAKGTGLQQLRMNAGATAPEWFTENTQGKAKFYVKTTPAGVIQGDAFNVSSVTDGGVGIITVNLTTAFSSANWVCQVTMQLDSTVVRVPAITAQAAGSVTITTISAAGAAIETNVTAIHVSGFGEQ